MIDAPLVSIITTSYNYGRYIGETIRSVLAQSYSNWEMIISDDGSTDDSLDVIRSFDDPRIMVITAERNQGAAAAYLLALAQCRGKYLMSLDSDDAISINQIERQVQFLEAHAEIDILGTYIEEINANSERIVAGAQAQWFNQELDLNDPSTWTERNHLCHSSVLMRRSVHEQLGAPNPDLIYTPDYEQWVRCLVAGFRFAVLPDELTRYRVHTQNISLREQGNERVFLERLYIFCNYLKPLLSQQGRHDLVGQTLRAFWRLATKHFPSYAQALIVAHVADIAAMPFTAFATWLSLVKMEEYLSAASIIDALLTEWQDRQDWIDALQAHVRYVEGRAEGLQQELQNWQFIAEQRADWIKQVEEARDYHHQQAQNWQRIAETRTVSRK